MITHLCGKPTIDDGKPMQFIYDDHCQQCNELRSIRLRASLRELFENDLVMGSVVPGVGNNHSPSTSALMAEFLDRDHVQSFSQGYPVY
jgi:hypothetical protein